MRFPSEPLGEGAGHALQSKRPVTIWLVEDSPTDAFVIREALNLCGFRYTLQSVTDGEAALQLLHAAESGDCSELPDLVLLDLNLPKVSGMEVLSAIRAATRCTSVPVVVVTSSDSPSDIASARRLGATDYFRKPSDLDSFLQLSDVVKKAIAAGAGS